MDETADINGVCVKIPKIKSKTDTGFPIFDRPDWVPDQISVSCMKCGEKFTHFKRKHHCRSCGKIFCSKCCSLKVSLPHFGISEPQKVCGGCSHISRLIVQCKSNDEVERHEAFFGLLKMIDSSELHKVLECGGLHVMLLHNLEDDLIIMEVIASVLHIAAQQMSLNKFLVHIGVLKTLKSILTLGSEYHHLLNDSLSALYLLCKEEETRNEAIREKVLEPVLIVLNIPGTASTLAARVMLLLLSDFDLHEYLLQNYPQIIQSLFRALQIEDYQMQGVITKMLTILSAGSDTARQSLLLEDERHGFPLKYLLKGSSSVVLLNTACIIANIAVIQREDIGQHYLEEICDLLVVLERSDESINLITQLIRGLANFAEVESNHDFLIPHVSFIIKNFLQSSEPDYKYHVCRLILSILTSNIESSNFFMFSDEVRIFLSTLLNLPGVTDFLNTSLLRKVSKLSICNNQVL